jgi:hypothetical protein
LKILEAGASDLLLGFSISGSQNVNKQKEKDKMKTGKSLVELATELQRQQESKRDFVSPASKVRLESNWNEGAEKQEVKMAIEGVQNNGSRLFDIGNYAHSQLASFCDIPKVYHDRLLEEDPSLLVHNVNRRLDHHGTKGRMVRTLDGRVRAVLSDRFRPLDNFDLMEAILPVLTETPGLTVESCDVTPTRLYIKAVTNKVEFDLSRPLWEDRLDDAHGMIQKEKQEVVQAGIVISNSEIGAGSVRIEPMLYFLACLNGMIVADSSMRKYHVGRSSLDINNAQEMFRDETRATDDAAFWMKVRDVVAGSFNQIDFERMAKRVAATQHNEIEAGTDPVKVIELTAKKFGFNETEKTGVLTEFLKRGEMTQFGLQAAVTRHSQAVSDYDRATELERVGGKVIELNQADWRAIVQEAA